jgi:hypothetical protein
MSRPAEEACVLVRLGRLTVYYIIQLHEAEQHERDREREREALSRSRYIEVVETFKYLGVTLDSRLDWNPHVDHKVKMAKRYLMMIHQGIGTTWGPSPAIPLWLCTGFVRPFLTYGSVVWAQKTSMVRVTNKLKKVQQLGMLMVAPMRSHTPTTGQIEIILGVPPLDLYIQFLAATTSNRLNLQPIYQTVISKIDVSPTDGTKTSQPI